MHAHSGDASRAAGTSYRKIGKEALSNALQKIRTLCVANGNPMKFFRDKSRVGVPTTVVPGATGLERFDGQCREAKVGPSIAGPRLAPFTDQQTALMMLAPIPTVSHVVILDA